jgi:DnaJ family protein A protein 2
VKCTLEEIYNGKSAKIPITRDKLCSKCDGKGGENGANSTCTGCKGRGVQTKLRMLGPGMYTQSTGPCSDCGGSGEQIDEALKCKQCNGKKVMKEKKSIEVEIDKGSPHAQKYVFHGEADEAPNVDPGDVIVIVEE